MAVTASILGRVAVSTSNANLVTGPANGATFSVRIVNVTAATIGKVTISLSSSSGSHLTSGYLLPPEFVIQPGEVVELTGLVIETGNYVVIDATANSVLSAVAYGMEL